jgi:hypothetical protein
MQERFWSKVQKSNACWLWTAARCSTGYGHFNVDGCIQKANRVAYELVKGPIPKGLTLDHLCRNKKCVNPDHLEPVTIAENVLRGMGSPAMNARKIFCKHGHELSGDNLYLRREGGRKCRACQRVNANRNYMMSKRRAA